MKNQVVVYSKPGCCLCDKVREQLQRLERTQPFSWQEVNILEDAEARDQFQEDIPVVFINGQKAFEHRLDERKFVELISSAT